MGTEYLSRVLSGLWKTVYSRLVSRQSTMVILPTIPGLCPRWGQGTMTHTRQRVCNPLGLASRERALLPSRVRLHSQPLAALLA